MVHGTVSSKAIIQQVQSGFGVMIESDEDVKEWIGDCIELIGYHVGFRNKIRKAIVENFIIHKPVDFFSLNYFMYDAKELRKQSDSYRLAHTYNTSSNSADTQPVILDRAYELLNLREDWCCEGRDVHDLARDIAKNIQIIDIHQNRNTRNEYYITFGENWRTNIENDDKPLYIFYKAFTLDDEGFPMIYDEINYRMAVRWYTLLCMMNNGYRHPTLSYEFVSLKSDNYIAKASNYGAKFSKGQKEQFILDWTSLDYGKK